MRETTVCTGVVKIASASEAPAARPRICKVRRSRQTPATMPSNTSARILTVNPPRLRGDRDLLQQIELVRDLAGAERHARQRILTRRHRKVCLLPQQVVEPAE